MDPNQACGAPYSGYGTSPQAPSANQTATQMGDTSQNFHQNPAPGYPGIHHAGGPPMVHSSPFQPQQQPKQQVVHPVAQQLYQANVHQIAQPSLIQQHQPQQQVVYSVAQQLQSQLTNVPEIAQHSLVQPPQQPQQPEIFVLPPPLQSTQGNVPQMSLSSSVQPQQQPQQPIVYENPRQLQSHPGSVPQMSPSSYVHPQLQPTQSDIYALPPPLKPNQERVHQIPPVLQQEYQCINHIPLHLQKQDPKHQQNFRQIQLQDTQDMPSSNSGPNAYDYWSNYQIQKEPSYQPNIPYGAIQQNVSAATGLLPNVQQTPLAATQTGSVQPHQSYSNYPIVKLGYFRYENKEKIPFYFDVNKYLTSVQNELDIEQLDQFNTLIDAELQFRKVCIDITSLIGQITLKIEDKLDTDKADDDSFSELTFTGSAASNVNTGFPVEFDFLLPNHMSFEKKYFKDMISDPYIWKDTGLEYVNTQVHAAGVCLNLKLLGHQAAQRGISIDVIPIKWASIDDRKNIKFRPSAEDYFKRRDFDTSLYTLCYKNPEDLDTGLIENVIICRLDDETKRGYRIAKHLLHMSAHPCESYQNEPNECGSCVYHDPMELEERIELFGYKNGIKSYYLRILFLHLIMQTDGSPIQSELKGAKLTLCLLRMLEMITSKNTNQERLCFEFDHPLLENTPNRVLTFQRLCTSIRDIMEMYKSDAEDKNVDRYTDYFEHAPSFNKKSWALC